MTLGLPILIIMEIHTDGAQISTMEIITQDTPIILFTTIA